MCLYRAYRVFCDLFFDSDVEAPQEEPQEEIKLKISEDIKAAADQLFYRATLAQITSNYDEVLAIAKELINIDPDRCCMQLEWLKYVMKQSLDKTFAARQKIYKTEQAAIKHRKLNEAALAKEYRKFIENEIYHNCNKVLNLLEDDVLPRAKSLETKIMYYLLHAEFCIYLYKMETSVFGRKDSRGLVLKSFRKADNLAVSKLKSWDRLRLECCLCYCCFLYEVLKYHEVAIYKGQKALEEAMMATDTMDIEANNFSESQLHLQLLKSKVLRWREEQQMETVDFGIPLIEIRGHSSEPLAENAFIGKRVYVLDASAEQIVNIDYKTKNLSASADQLIQKFLTENSIDGVNNQIGLSEQLVERIRSTYSICTTSLSSKTSSMEIFATTTDNLYPPVTCSSALSKEEILSMDEQTIFGTTKSQLMDECKVNYIRPVSSSKYISTHSASSSSNEFIDTIVKNDNASLSRVTCLSMNLDKDKLSNSFMSEVLVHDQYSSMSSITLKNANSIPDIGNEFQLSSSQFVENNSTSNDSQNKLIKSNSIPDDSHILSTEQLSNSFADSNELTENHIITMDSTFQGKENLTDFKHVTEPTVEYDSLKIDVNKSVSSSKYSLSIAEKCVTSEDLPYQYSNNTPNTSHENISTEGSNNQSTTSPHHPLTENISDGNSKTLLTDEVSKSNLSEITISSTESDNRMTTHSSSQFRGINSSKTSLPISEQYSSYENSNSEPNKSDFDMLARNKLTDDVENQCQAHLSNEDDAYHQTYAVCKLTSNQLLQTASSLDNVDYQSNADLSGEMLESNYSEMTASSSESNKQFTTQSSHQLIGMDSSKTSLLTKKQNFSHENSNIQCTKTPFDVLAKKNLTGFSKNECKSDLSTPVLSNILTNKDKDDVYNLTYSKTSYRLVNEKTAEVDSDNETKEN